MNVLRRFGLPIVVVAPVVAAVAVLWNYLLQFASNDGVKILIYLSMCLLALAAAAAAQHFVPEHTHQYEEEKKADEGCEAKSK